MTDPDQIRREIEATRRNLSDDVDALAYKASPHRMVEDRKQRVRGALYNAKDRIMGSAHGVGESGSSAVGTLHDKASAAASGVGDAASSVGDAAQRAPRVVRRQTQGNPLAAGLIAFGVGWLVSSLLPASEREQQAAQRLADGVREHSDTLKEKASEVAHELRDNLQEPAQQAAQSVKERASEAVENVKDDGRSQVGEVRDHARDARNEVRS